MATIETSPQKREKLSLLWQFLTGAKRYFFICILSAGITALADMIQPIDGICLSKPFTPLPLRETETVFRVVAIAVVVGGHQ